MELTERALKEGNAFVYRTPIETDDCMECTAECIDFGKGRIRFAVWFNGALIHTSKTYKSMVNKVEVLKKKWSLVFDRVEEGI